MKIVHAADLHIDSPLKGLERYEGAPHQRVRGATREAFKRVIATALEHRARFLVLAGDVFDGDWKDMNTGLFFVRELRALREVGCDVVLVRGNHDFELTRALDYPEHVHEFAPPGRGAHSFVFEHEGVAFHGVSYPKQRVEHSLLPDYPEPIDGALNIGVLHTNATASKAHEAYAPCTVSDLVSKGYSYWALGHVHSHEVLHRDPWVVYPGNTQGRSVRETGVKGCVAIEVDAGRIARVDFVKTSVMRYFDESIALQADDDRDALHDKVRARLDEIASASDGELAAVRLRVHGGCRAHGSVVAEREGIVAQIRADAIDRGDDVWLEKITLSTSPPTSIEELRRAKGLLAELLQHTERLRTDEGGDLERLARSLEPIKKKLGKELEELAIDFVNDRELLLRVLDEAEAILAQRLTEGAP